MTMGIMVVFFCINSLVLAGSITFIQEDSESSVSSEQETAMNYFNKGMYEEAILECNKLIQKSPADARAYSLRGHAYTRVRKYDNAIVDFDAAIGLKQPEALPGVYFGKGYVFFIKNENDKALINFSYAIEAHPDFEVAYLYRGKTYSRLGDFDKAMSDLDKVLSLNSKNAKAFCGKGDVYENKGDIQSAIYNYKKTIELDPVYEYPYRALMHIFLILKDYDSVFYYSNKAIESCKEPGFAYRARGGAHLLLHEDYQSAHNDLLVAKKLGENVDSDIQAVEELMAMEEASVARRREITQLEHEIVESKYRSRQLDTMGQFMSDMQTSRTQQVQENYFKESLRLQRQAVRNQEADSINRRGSYGNPIHVKIDEY